MVEVLGTVESERAAEVAWQHFLAGLAVSLVAVGLAVWKRVDEWREGSQ